MKNGHYVLGKPLKYLTRYLPLYIRIFASTIVLVLIISLLGCMEVRDIVLVNNTGETIVGKLIVSWWSFPDQKREFDAPVPFFVAPNSRLALKRLWITISVPETNYYEIDYSIDGKDRKLYFNRTEIREMNFIIKLE